MILIFFVLGSVLASFALCYFERRAEGISIISPPSSCDFCKNRLKTYDLLPVISYIALRGRCRYCGEKIPLIKLTYEILGGLLGLISFYIFKDIRSIFILLALIISLNIVTSDLKDLEIYEEDLIALGVLGLFYRMIFLRLSFTYFKISLIFVLGFLALRFISKGGIGDGDLFFYEALFLFLKEDLILSFILYSIWLGGAYALIKAFKEKSLKETIAFCPPIFLAFILTNIFGRIL